MPICQLSKIQHVLTKPAALILAGLKRLFVSSRAVKQIQWVLTKPAMFESLWPGRGGVLIVRVRRGAADGSNGVLLSKPSVLLTKPATLILAGLVGFESFWLGQIEGGSWLFEFARGATDGSNGYRDGAGRNGPAERLARNPYGSIRYISNHGSRRVLETAESPNVIQVDDTDLIPPPLLMVRSVRKTYDEGSNWTK
ncbi:hypothetical protein BD779DRAFT_1472419 [Infundibulicybe gibba]|nr:hypothetical protein BD779DRAFT_1472419 [Infundibulicybe gibba]